MPELEIKLRASPIYCRHCHNKIGVRRHDGRIIVRWKGRTVEFDAGSVTCENCALVNALDSSGNPVLA